MKRYESSEALSLPAVVATFPTRQRLSSIVEDLCSRAGHCVTVQEIRDALGERSFATLLLFFALLNLLPLPPGTTLVLGLPLMLVALQMLSGREAVWLPKFLLSKSLTADQFRKLAEKMLPRLQWLEGRVRPRYWPFGNSRMAERTIGLVALILGTVVTLPIPFGNWFPALACALFGLALAERDGLVLVAAGVAVIIAITMLGVVFGTAGVMASMVFS